MTHLCFYCDNSSPPWRNHGYQKKTKMITRILLLIALLIGVSTRDVEAQAWTPEPGALTASAAYTHSKADSIALSGDSLPDGATSHLLDLAVEYGTPLEGLTVDVSLPIVGAKINDDNIAPHFPVPGEWDDGEFHAAPSDIRAGLRYQVLSDPVAIAIHAAGSVPTWQYPVKGFTAPGRGLRALHAGVSVGYATATLLPQLLYVHASYEFTVRESFETFDPETSDFSQKQSKVAMQVGYYVLDELAINLASDIVRSHGGVNFADFGSYTETTREFHDGLLNEDLLLLGGGVTYTLTERVDVGAAVRIFTSGLNTREANLFNVSLGVKLL